MYLAIARQQGELWLTARPGPRIPGNAKKKKNKTVINKRHSINITDRFWILCVGHNFYHTLDFLYLIIPFPLLLYPILPPKTQKKKTKKYLGEFLLSSSAIITLTKGMPWFTHLSF